MNILGNVASAFERVAMEIKKGGGGGLGGGL